MPAQRGMYYIMLSLGGARSVGRGEALQVKRDTYILRCLRGVL